MLLIYTTKSSKRLKYVFELIFEDILGLSIVYTLDKEMFVNSDLAKINYSTASFGEALYFRKVDLLFENGIEKQELNVDTHANKTALFFHDDKTSILPFDPFAMIFYLVVRYEEYTANELDHHGRFAAHQSVAYQHSFLHQPLVNEWILEIEKILKQHYPKLPFKKNQYQFTPTYDIDYAWAYQHKGFLRTLGASARDFLKNRNLFVQRLKVLVGAERDPYFTFDYLDNLHQRLNINPIYFFLVGKRGEYDKNISTKKKSFQQLIYQIAQQYKVGLHPSYASNASFRKLEEEHKDLENISEQAIVKSRQHFLKLSFPSTYRNLIKLGVKEDYSMGYAAEVGFRASIASSFYWFDLEKNEKTDLRVFPFQLMDVTLKEYLELSPEKAILLAKKIIEQTKAVNGHLMTLFHNNSFCEQEGWKGWRVVYEEILKEGIV